MRDEVLFGETGRIDSLDACQVSEVALAPSRTCGRPVGSAIQYLIRSRIAAGRPETASRSCSHSDLLV